MGVWSPWMEMAEISFRSELFSSVIHLSEESASPSYASAPREDRNSLLTGYGHPFPMRALSYIDRG